MKFDMLFRDFIKKSNISILEKIEKNVDGLRFFNFKYMGKTYQFIRRNDDEPFVFTLDVSNTEGKMVIDIIHPSKIFPLVKEWNDKFPFALEIGNFEYFCNYDRANKSEIIISPHQQDQVMVIDKLKKNSDRIHFMIGKLHGRRLVFFREGINENLIIAYERNDNSYNEINDIEEVQDFFNTMKNRSDFVQVSYFEFYTEEDIKRDLNKKRRYCFSNIKDNLNSIKRIYIEHTDNVFLFNREKDTLSYILVYGESFQSATSRIEYDVNIMIGILSDIIESIPIDTAIFEVEMF